MGSTHLLSYWSSYSGNQGVFWLCGLVMYVEISVFQHAVSPPGCFDTVVAAHAIYPNSEKEENSMILAILNNYMFYLAILSFQFLKSSS